MKVLFFLPQLGGGGAEMNAVRLAGGLLQNAIVPIYVVARGPGSYAKHLPPEVEVRVLDTGRIRSSTLRIVRSIGPLARMLEELRPDVAVPVMPASTLALLAAVRHSSYKPRVAPSMQNTLERKDRGLAAATNILETALLRRWLPRADRIIALSHGVAGEFERSVPALAGRIDVVHNIGLPLPGQLEAAEPDLPVRTPGRTRFVACGRLVEQKGYSFLLKAFAKVAAEQDAELHILGVGPLQPTLERLGADLGIAERVRFLGFRSNPFAHMKAADVFVLSSLWEGFGNVIVEAMAMGTAVVSTRCPHGPDEIITDGEDGMLVPVGNVEALAAGMLRLSKDADLRERIAQRGILRAQDFSAEKISTAFATALRRLAGAPTPVAAA